MSSALHVADLIGGHRKYNLLVYKPKPGRFPPTSVEKSAKKAASPGDEESCDSGSQTSQIEETPGQRNFRIFVIILSVLTMASSITAFTLCAFFVRGVLWSVALFIPCPTTFVALKYACGSTKMGRSRNANIQSLKLNLAAIVFIPMMVLVFFVFCTYDLMHSYNDKFCVVTFK